MNPKSLRCLSALGLALCLLQAVPAPASTPVEPAAAPASSNAGSILARRVTGRVDATDKPTRQQRQLVNESRVNRADVVSTADDGRSSVVLVFSTGTTVHLRHGSVLDIEEFQQEPWSGKAEVSLLESEPSSSQTRLNLVKGELLGKVTKLRKDGSSTMQVRTPVGVAGIRGTTFHIIFRPDPQRPGYYIFHLATAEGRVEFQPSAPGALPLMVEGNREIGALVQVRIDPVTGVVVPVSTPVFKSGTQPISSETLQQIQTMVVEVLQAVQGLIISSSSNDHGAGASTTGQAEQTRQDQGQPGETSQQPSDKGQEGDQVRFSTETQDPSGTAPADSIPIPDLPPQEPATPPRVTSGEGR